MNGAVSGNCDLGAAPTGLRRVPCACLPALKRWANKLCAYGAGFLILAGPMPHPEDEGQPQILRLVATATRSG